MLCSAGLGALGSSAQLILSSGAGGSTGRRHRGIVAALAIALALGSEDDLLTEHLIFHDKTVGDSLVADAATVIFQKLFARWPCLEFRLYYTTKCNPTAAPWRVGFISYPIILYSLKICTACAASSCSPSQALGFVLGDASNRRSCSL